MHKDTKEELKRLQEALLEEPVGPNTPPKGRLYNADKTDIDLDSFSEAVLAGPKRSRAGLIIVLLLMAAVILWLFIRYGGIFA